MNKRLAFLVSLVQSGKADSFARYALALEHKKEGNVESALAAFVELRGVDPNYVPQYLMAGRMLIESSRPAEARAWLEAGLAVARERGDGHAVGELQEALGDC